MMSLTESPFAWCDYNQWCYSLCLVGCLVGWSSDSWSSKVPQHNAMEGSCERKTAWVLGSISVARSRLELPGYMRTLRPLPSRALTVVAWDNLSLWEGTTSLWERGQALMLRSLRYFILTTIKPFKNMFPVYQQRNIIGPSLKNIKVWPDGS